MPKNASELAGSNEINDRLESEPYLTKIPLCASALSALVYFLSSEGIRNHLLFLAKAFGSVRVLH